MQRPFLSNNQTMLLNGLVVHTNNYIYKATIPQARTPYSFIRSHSHSLRSKGMWGLKGHFNLITLESKCYRAVINQYRSGLNALIVQRREGPYNHVTWSIGLCGPSSGQFEVIQQSNWTMTRLEWGIHFICKFVVPYLHKDVSEFVINCFV